MYISNAFYISFLALLPTLSNGQSVAATSSSCALVDGGGTDYYFFGGTDGALYVRFGRGNPSTSNFTLTQVLPSGFTTSSTPLACTMAITDGNIALTPHLYYLSNGRTTGVNGTVAEVIGTGNLTSPATWVTGSLQGDRGVPNGNYGNRYLSAFSSAEGFPRVTAMCIGPCLFTYSLSGWSAASTIFGW